MGGLKKKIPITHLTFLIGTLAISGFPFLSGMISKDEILVAAYAASPIYWGILFLIAAFTATYMFRMYYLTFHGSFRGTEEQKHHIHESPLNMTLPLVVLAVLSIVGGFFNIPKLFGENDFTEKIAHWIRPVLTEQSWGQQEANLKQLSAKEEALYPW